MNSLKDLNTASKRPVKFSDARSTSVTYDHAQGSNLGTFWANTTINSNVTIRTQANLTSAINGEPYYVTLTSNGVTRTSGFSFYIYAKPVPNLSNGSVRVTWPNITGTSWTANLANTGGSVKLNNVGTGNLWLTYQPTNPTGPLFLISGIKCVSDYELVKSPILTFSSNAGGRYNAVCNLEDSRGTIIWTSTTQIT